LRRQKPQIFPLGRNERVKSVQLLWVGRFYKNCGDGVKVHSHPFYHLIYTKSGRLALSAGGEAFSLGEGECVVIPNEMRHSYLNEAEGVAEMWEIKFTFPNESMATKIARYGVLQGREPLIGVLIEQILKEFSELGNLADEAAESYLLAILHAMTQPRRQKNRGGFRYVDATDFSSLSQEVIHYLEENFHRNFSLDELASTLGNNKSYLCTAFKKDTQITINDCLNMIRIRRAAALVAYSDNGLDQIAAMCGFSSTSHFNRVFLKYVGTTPGQCRKAYPCHIQMNPEKYLENCSQRPDRFMYSVLAQKQITPEEIHRFELK